MRETVHVLTEASVVVPSMMAVADEFSATCHRMGSIEIDTRVSIAARTLRRAATAARCGGVLDTRIHCRRLGVARKRGDRTVL